ncbi:MAG: 3-phosphoshikimate 1-carboxyvinyltransferase, partial [Gammaproteobacteria bacterium]
MIAINPPANITDKTLSLPGSKYIANRLLILAALTEGECVFDNVPANDDIQTAQAGLSKLGAHFEFSDGRLTSRGIQGSNPAADGTIYTSHSGTFSRFVVAVAALSHDWVSLNGSAKMNSRPMADLFAALRNAGVQIESSENDTLPARIKGPITADTITISGAISSQYISALLLIAAKLEKGLTIQLTCEPVSKPY